MQGTQEDIKRAIAVLAESVLMPRILTFYEDIETTSKTKQEQKDKCVEEFVLHCMKKFNMPEDEVRGLVDALIKKYKWIVEIEELDEEEELE